MSEDLKRERLCIYFPGWCFCNPLRSLFVSEWKWMKMNSPEACSLGWKMRNYNWGVSHRLPSETAEFVKWAWTTLICNERRAAQSAIIVQRIRHSMHCHDSYSCDCMLLEGEEENETKINKKACEKTKQNKEMLSTCTFLTVRLKIKELNLKVNGKNKKILFRKMVEISSVFTLIDMI